MDKVSYALGMSIANNMLASGIKEIKMDDFAKAFDVVFNHMEPDMTISQAEEVLNKYFQSLQKEQFEANKKEGEEFLKENAKKEGVKVLPGGLQYRILKEGDGPKPALHDQVKCEYEGKLVNGAKFDSSYDRHEPAVFGVNQVIPGWTEALQLMPQGSKWELYIPYNLAYGERGAGQSIPPYSALIFVVELLEVIKQK